LKDRNATLEKEVKRFEERQALEDKVSFRRLCPLDLELIRRQKNLLDVILPFVEYKLAMLEYRNTKEERARHQERLKILKKKYQPMLQLKEYG
jgi:hypothetical protein